MNNLLLISESYILNLNLHKCLEVLKQLEKEVEHEYSRFKQIKSSDKEEIRIMIQKNNDFIYKNFIQTREKKIKALQIAILYKTDNIDDFFEKIKK